MAAGSVAPGSGRSGIWLPEPRLLCPGDQRPIPDFCSRGENRKAAGSARHARALESEVATARGVAGVCKGQTQAARGWPLPKVRRCPSALRGLERGGRAGVLARTEDLVVPGAGQPGVSRLFFGTRRDKLCPCAAQEGLRRV